MYQRFSLADIMDMERSYRRDFINTLSGYKPANLIGTLSTTGRLNAAIFNSVLHIGAKPPLLGLLMRPLTVPRQTYDYIKAQNCFTINSVSQEIYRQAHQTGAKYDEETSELEATGLTPLFTDALAAPYVAESAVKIGLELEEEHHIRANGCLLIVGKVIEVLVAESLLSDAGHVRLEAADTVAVSGLDRYFLPRLLSQEDYPRP